MTKTALACAVLIGFSALADWKYRHISTTFSSEPKRVGSGKRQVEVRTTDAVHSVEAGAGFVVKIVAGPPSTKVSWDDNLISLVKIRNDKGTLRVELDTEKVGGLSSELSPEIEVSTPSPIRSLDLSGGANATLLRSTESQFRVTLSGGAQLDASAVAASVLTLELSGGASATLSGKSDSARVDVSGGARLKGVTLTVRKATFDISGGANAEMTVSEEATGEVSGAANLKVQGSPKVMKISTSGVGFINGHTSNDFFSGRCDCVASVDDGDDDDEEEDDEDSNGDF